MYFHKPTKYFRSFDLAICSPFIYKLCEFSVDAGLRNRDHFPIIVTINKYQSPKITRPIKYIYEVAEWTLFSTHEIISRQMVDEPIDEAVIRITRFILDAAFLKTFGKLQQCGNHGGTVLASS